MPASEEYKKKFSLLLEYNIKQGVIRQSTQPSFVKEAEGDEDDAIPSIGDQTDATPTTDVVDEPPVTSAPTEYENTEELEKIKKDEEEKELAKEDDITRVKKIQDLQTQTIEALERSVLEFESQIEELKAKTADMDAVKENIEIVREKVKQITPLTPEEALVNVPKITGGISIEDYWAQYLAENDPTKAVVETETDTLPLKQYSVNINDIKNGNIDVKETFYK